MAVINKGISKAVKEAFINGTHEPEAMLVKLAHLNTDENRKSYLINLTKDLRAKYGMDVERNKNFGRGKKKTGAKSSKQLALNFTKQSKFYNEKSRELAMARHEAIQAEGKSEVFVNPVTGHDLADAMRKHDMSNIVEIRKQVYRPNIRKLADLAMQDTDLVARLHELADAMPTAQDIMNSRISDEDRIVEEYVKLDDDHKALQGKYDDLFDNVAELKREIVRLQVIVTYLEGKK